MEHLLHCYVAASTVTAEPTEPLALSTLACASFLLGV